MTAHGADMQPTSFTGSRNPAPSAGLIDYWGK